MNLPPLHESWLPRDHGLHRPRHGRRQRIALVCAVLFFAAPLLALGFGARPAPIDNRLLVAFPSVTEGWGFFTALPQWGTDHVTFRAAALRGADAVSRGVFGEPPSFTRGQLGVDPIDPVGPGAGLAVPPAIEGRDGWLFDGDDVISRCAPAQPLATTIAALRRLRAAVTASGRRFVLIIAPDKSTVLPRYLPGSYVGKSCAAAATARFWRLLPESTGALDLRSSLVAWPLGAYPPQDAHWSDEGALTMTRALADAIQPVVTRTWVSRPVRQWTQAADLPPLIGHHGLDHGEYYSLAPDGHTDQARNVPFDFTTPLHLAAGRVPGTVTVSVGFLGDSFTIRALRYFQAAFTDIDVLHYGWVTADQGRTAGEMLARDRVVAVELVERTLESGNNVLLRPAVLNGIGRVLAEHPMR